MQILIEIDEYIVERVIKNIPMYPGIVDMITNAIKTGTPLPKNHGRLIDADELMDKVFFISNENESYEAVYAEDIADAPTIIEEVKADDTK